MLSNPLTDEEKRQEWLDSLIDGEPCDHPGCLSHVSHPCEGCERMKTAISYDLERVLIEKLKAIHVYRIGNEISLYNGLVQGHTDGRIMDDLLEIKTIGREEWFPQHHLPVRVFFQVQAYLHYLDINFAQVIYLARDTGAVQVYKERHDIRRGDEIARKVERLMSAVTTMKRPECSCGRCNPG